MADKGDGTSSTSYPLSRTVLNDITNENLSSRRPPSFLSPRSRPLVRRPSATSSSNLRQASLTELLGAGAAPRSPVYAGTPSGQKRAFEGGSSAQPATSDASSPVSSQSSLVCHGRSRVNSRDSDAGWSKEVSDGEVRSKRFRLDIVVGLDADRVEGREDIEDGPGQEHDQEVAMESIPRPRKIKDRAFLPTRTMDVSHAVLTKLAMREALKPSQCESLRVCAIYMPITDQDLVQSTYGLTLEGSSPTIPSTSIAFPPNSSIAIGLLRFRAPFRTVGIYVYSIHHAGRSFLTA